MFEIGEKILCVDDSLQPHTIEELRQDVPNFVKKGQQYTVRGFSDSDFVVGVLLEEIRNPLKYFRLVGGVREPSFALWRFEKIKTEEILEEKLAEVEIN